jgi:hypothetical protein
MSDDQFRPKTTQTQYKLILYYGGATTLLAIVNLLVRMNLIANGVDQSSFVMTLSYGLLIFGVVFLGVGLVMWRLKK